MMIGSATVAVAAEGDQVQAIFAKFNLIVNGQPKDLETIPLVYNGTSYLPVREMANLVGYDVTWKADNRTIELNQSTSLPEPTATPTQTPTTPTPSSPSPTTVPQEIKVYNIGEEIQLKSSKIKVNKVDYQNNLDTLRAGEGNTFAVVNFDVYIDSATAGNEYYSANRFVSEITLGSGKPNIGLFSTGSSMKIKEDSWQNVNIATEIPEDEKATGIIVRSPNSFEKASVKFNQ